MIATNLTRRKKIPATEVTTGRPCRYPWRQMEVGQSFFVPGTKKLPIYYWRKKTGFRYMTRLLVEREVTGLRVWRIE